MFCQNSESSEFFAALSTFLISVSVKSSVVASCRTWCMQGIMSCAKVVVRGIRVMTLVRALSFAVYGAFAVLCRKRPTFCRSVWMIEAFLL